MKLITINESFTVDSLLPIRLKCNKFGKKQCNELTNSTQTDLTNKNDSTQTDLMIELYSIQLLVLVLTVTIPKYCVTIPMY